MNSKRLDGYFLILLIFLFSWFIFCYPLWGNESSEYSAFRFLEKSVVPGKNVSFDISFGNLIEKEGEPFIPLLCEMDAKHDYSYVEVSLEITDEKNDVVKSPINSNQTVSLAKGYNRSLFLLPLQKLKDGTYKGTVQAKYTAEEKPAIVNFKMEKISSKGLEEQLNFLSNEVESATPLIEREQVKINLLRNLLAQAREEFAMKHWEDLSDTLNTLQEQLSQIKSVPVEVGKKGEEYCLSDLKITTDGVFSGDKPINLVGVYVCEPILDKVKVITDYSIPLVVLPISLDKLYPAETVEGPLEGEIAEVLDYLFQNKIYIIIQFVQGQVPVWLYEKHPEVSKEGFVDLSQRPVWDLIERGYQKIISYCESNPLLLGVNILVDPKFKFDGEWVRNAFVEWVKVNYPDRQTLNQIWHAHLAKYDEITIWDDVAPKWSYQNRRAYQYDWQNFHREMISNLLKDTIGRIRKISENTPISITFPSKVFELDETKFTPDRERTIPDIDYISLNVTFNTEDTVYVQGYPDPVADVVWMRSISKGKPIVISCADLNYREGLTGIEKYKHTRSFLWEMILAGAQIVAVNVSGDLRENIEIWKAIADTNALFSEISPQLRAFQTSKPVVRILFSDSSKILDGGVPHLKSARLAYEGSSFAGYDVCFATEKEIEAGILQDTKVLIMPQTLSIENDVFNMITDFIRGDNYIIRVGTQIPYDPKGVSRRDVVQPTSNTVLVRGMNLPTEYLHGMDAVISKKALTPLPRPVNKVGYPLEGVKSRFIPTDDGGGYLYLLNLRKENVLCRLTGYLQKGTDLIGNKEIEFPVELQPLDLMFIKLVPPEYEKIVDTEQQFKDKEKKKKR